MQERTFLRTANIGFVGNGLTPTNHLGIQWFLEHCWEDLQRQLPGVRIRLIGRRAARAACAACAVALPPALPARCPHGARMVPACYPRDACRACVRVALHCGRTMPTRLRPLPPPLPAPLPPPLPPPRARRPPGERTVKGVQVECIKSEDAHCGWAWGTVYSGVEVLTLPLTLALTSTLTLS